MKEEEKIAASKSGRKPINKGKKGNDDDDSIRKTDLKAKVKDSKNSNSTRSRRDSVITRLICADLLSGPSRKRRKQLTSSSTQVARNKNDPKIAQESLMCHQCQRNDKGRVVRCLNCKKKRYCIPCATAWYPDMTEDQIAQCCPVCLENCNCKKCLRLDVPLKKLKDPKPKVSEGEKVQYAKYILQTLLPYLKQIDSEQMREKELDAKIQVTTAELLYLIFIGAAQPVHMIFVLFVVGNFVMENSKEVGRK